MTQYAIWAQQDGVCETQANDNLNLRCGDCRFVPVQSWRIQWHCLNYCSVEWHESKLSAILGMIIWFGGQGHWMLVKMLSACLVCMDLCLDEWWWNWMSRQKPHKTRGMNKGGLWYHHSVKWTQVTISLYHRQWIWMNGDHYHISIEASQYHINIHVPFSQCIDISC